MDFASLLSAAQAAADADPAARQQAVRAALTAADGTPNFAALEQAAAEAFAALSDDDAVLDETVFAQMGLIADVVDAVRAEAAEQNANRVTDLANRIGMPGTAPAAPTGTEPQQPTQPPPAQPTQPTEPQQPTQPEPTQPTEPGSELVVADGRQAARPVTRMRNLVPMQGLPVQLPGQTGGTPFAITAAADLPGINLGSDLTDIDGITRAVMARFAQLGRAGGDVGGSRAGIASITIDRDERLVANTQHDWAVIEYACDETRLPGGSLLAAADPVPGWCALGEISYEFCPPSIVDGIVDVPTVTARRGSLTWPQSPQFHEIYSGVGWCYTPAQIDNMQLPPYTGTPPIPPGYYDPAVGPAEKDCYKISCPPNADLVLQPCGLCLQASILHERTYPELIRYTVAQALVAHAHKMNCRILTQMEALGEQVDLTANANLGPGATAVMLEAIEMQVEWLRYRHRLGINTTMEMVAPVWMRGILRADLSKRMGIDLLEVDNARLDRFLRSRGVRPQWVLDWQDAFCDPTPPAPPLDPITASDLFGGDASRTAWPLTGKVMIYPAGTYFLARMDIINIEGGLLDSTLLRKNERIVLFTEEALAVGRRCYQSSVLNFNLCPSGQTGSGKAIACAATPGA